MQLTASALGSADIAGIVTLRVKTGRSIMGKEECRGFDVLTRLNFGSSMTPGGVYEEYRLKYPYGGELYGPYQ